jgi:outer membrane protein TolC
MTILLAALYFNPDLDVARKQVEVAEAGIITAGERPNPSLRVAPGYATFPTNPWIFDFLPSIPIETAGRRGYRIAVAQRVADAARLQLSEVVWRVRMRLRAALVDRFAALRELDVLEQEERLRQSAADLLEARFEHGYLARPVLTAARAELDNTKLAVLSARGRLEASRTELAGAIGLPMAALQGVAIVWPTFGRPPASLAKAPVQRAAILNRLDVRRSLVEYAATESALQLEVARQYPDIQLGPGYQLDEGANKFSLGLQAVLPVFNRNQGPIAQAEARRKEAGSRFLAVQARAINEAEGALAQYRNALARLQEAAALTKLWSRQVHLAQASMDTGQASRLTLVGVLLGKAAAAGTRASALRNAQAALGALENVVERPLDASWEPPNEAAPPRAGERR